MLSPLLATPAQAAENLLAHPSFEAVHEPDQFGRCFTGWEGWVYEQPARIEVGHLAHHGDRACALISNQGGKVRMYMPSLKLAAGRYRFQAMLRGLDIGPGRWGKAVEFGFELDNQWLDLGLHGSFGWRPVTYVFEIAEEQANKPFKIFLGLYDEGRLWIDSCELVATNELDDELTPKPVVGPVAVPLKMPGDLPDNPVRCVDCAYRNAPEWQRCYACGQALDAVARTLYDTPPSMLLADFEDAAKGTAPFGQGTREVASPLTGTASLRLARGFASWDAPLDWSQHDFLQFDVHNPQAAPLLLYIEVRDVATKDYWTRVNYETLVPPGRSTVNLPTALYVGEKSRPGRPLLRDRITRFVVAVGDRGTLLFDDFRLIRIDRSAAAVPGMLAFDFGPPDAPLMTGFDRGPTAGYSAGRGWGWVDASFWRTFNVLQPDQLSQDFLCPESGVLQLDVPNGRYHVAMLLDSPGGYWGEVQRYRQRRVTVNGTVVVDETLDAETFTARYWRDAQREDLPGISPFDTYIREQLPLRQLTVDVTDGAIRVEFNGKAWACCLSALVVYPDSQRAGGERFLDWVDGQRRFQFDNFFRQIPPPRRGTPAPASGYQLFSRDPMAPVNPADGPDDHERLDDAGLTVTALRGEETMVTLSVQPGESLGALAMTLSPMRAGDVQLADSAIAVGWLDYRLSRVTMDGAVYTVAPRYWHPAPAPAADGVTRRFWLRIRVPVDAVPGTYRGTITVAPAQAPATAVPLRLVVQDAVLPEIADLAVGPWGSGIDLPWFGDDPVTSEWNARLFTQTLTALREAGCTSLSTRPHLQVKAANGMVSLDTTVADREMAAMRDAGFSLLISSYGIRWVGYDLYKGTETQASLRTGFGSVDEMVASIFAAIDAHAVKANWLPVAWNLCDEPVGDAIIAATANAELHRRVAASLKRNTFMGATSMTGDSPADPHTGLLKALPLPALNSHDEASVALLKAAGNRFVFYNSGNRWTFGRYMRMLVSRHQLAMRLTWHFNIAAGNPYYALDCREDDYCWFNSDAAGRMVPSVLFLTQVLPGLNDYRYLTLLQQRLAAAKAKDPAAAGVAVAQAIWDAVLALRAGTDKDRHAARSKAQELRLYAAERAAVAQAILGLVP
jgi:hypothetical protein